MTVDELARELARRRVSASAYCLGGGLPNDALTIEQAGDMWRVYYRERGCRNGLQMFASEADACTAFLRLIEGFSTAGSGTCSVNNPSES